VDRYNRTEMERHLYDAPDARTTPDGDDADEVSQEDSEASSSRDTDDEVY
jgi:hypothetical protein